MKNKKNKFIKAIFQIFISALFISIFAGIFLGCSIVVNLQDPIKETARVVNETFVKPIVRPAITGNIDYEPISVVKGTVATITPQFWGSKKTDQTITYSINPALPSGVTLDSATGKINVLSTAEAYSHEHTITASGTEKFSGSKDVKVKIHIQSNPISGISGFINSLSYADKDVDIGTKTRGGIIISLTDPSRHTSVNVKYIIKPQQLGRNMEGIRIVNDTTALWVPGGAQFGDVVVDDTVTDIDGTYNVYAVGIGTHAGVIKSSIKLTLKSNLPTIAYNSGNIFKIGQGSEATVSPTPALSSGLANFTLTRGGPFPTGISLDENTGDIKIDNTTAIMTGDSTFTITITPLVGAGPKNPITANARIEVTAPSKDLETARLTYNNTTLVYGDGATITKNVESGGIPTASVPTYSIAPATTGININNNTGEVSVATTAPPISETEFTVTASPTATGYYNNKTTTFNITINKKNINTLNFSYGGATSKTYGTAAMTKPKDASSTLPSTTPGSVTMAYTVDTSDGKPALPATMSLDGTTGTITIGQNATVAQSGTYTIKATATGANYEGTKTATVTITINKHDISSGDFTYAGSGVLRVDQGTGGNIQITGNTFGGVGVAYAVDSATPFPTSGEISIVGATGQINVSALATQQGEQTYNIVATPTDTDNYMGSKQKTIKITVQKDISTYELTYNDINAFFGTAKEENPTTNTIPGGMFGAGATYSIVKVGATTHQGLSINSDGKITVADTANARPETEYRVTATVPVSSISAYKGTKTATVKITVTGASLPSTSVTGALPTITPALPTITPALPTITPALPTITPALPTITP